jgi:hypothetical protein
MENAERLLGALVHGHFPPDEVGPDGRDAKAKNAFDPDLYFFVHFDQADRRLADVLVQISATMKKKTAKAYHSGR